MQEMIDKLKHDIVESEKYLEKIKAEMYATAGRIAAFKDILLAEEAKLNQPVVIEEKEKENKQCNSKLS